MQKIAIFIDGYPIKYSTSILCLIDELSKNNFIHIYYKNLNLKPIENIYSNTIFIPEFPALMFSIKKTKLFRKSANFFNRIIYFFKIKYYKFILFLKFINSYYKNYIAIDPQGLIFCKHLFPKCCPVYYSMELYTKHDRSDYNKPILAEKPFIKDIKALIIQSDERKKIFIQENNLSKDLKSFILPVIYKQPSIHLKTNYLRQKFGIASSKPLIIHIGGLEEYYSCIELSESISRLSNYALIFHGFSFNNYKEKLSCYIKDKNITNVFITEDIFEKLEDISILLQSADIGIAWYKNISPNFETAGKSSGKISAYLQHGLPIITNNYPSMKSAIQDNNCGICISDFSELSNSLDFIQKNYQILSKNASNVYNRYYCFEKYRTSLQKFLNDL